MSNPPYADLVDRDMLAKAAADYAAAQTAATKAATEAKAAEAAATAAEKAGAAALVNGDAAAGKEADKALEAADRRLRVARQAKATTEAALANAELHRKRALGKAWNPVYEEGVRRRLAAAEAADQAREAIVKAAADCASAMAQMDHARREGSASVPYLHEQMGGLRTHKEEMAIVTAHGFVADTGTFAAWV